MWVYAAPSRNDTSWEVEWKDPVSFKVHQARLVFRPALCASHVKYLGGLHIRVYLCSFLLTICPPCYCLQTSQSQHDFIFCCGGLLSTILLVRSAQSSTSCWHEDALPYSLSFVSPTQFNVLRIYEVFANTSNSQLASSRVSWSHMTRIPKDKG